MKLRYQTGLAALIQFILMTLLGVPNALVSIITSCHKSGTECVSNLLVSLIFFLLTAAWFGMVAALGFAAQDRRSKRLALALMATEAVIAFVALFNARHSTNWLSLITSLLDIALALWVILLAYRLRKADGGRISSRPRQRRPPLKKPD